MRLGREPQPSFFVLAQHAAPRPLLGQLDDRTSVLLERCGRTVLLLDGPVEARAQRLQVPIQADFASCGTGSLGRLFSPRHARLTPRLGLRFDASVVLPARVAEGLKVMAAQLSYTPSSSFVSASSSLMNVASSSRSAISCRSSAA